VRPVKPIEARMTISRQYVTRSGDARQPAARPAILQKKTRDANI
jgi:hypothetical protein